MVTIFWAPELNKSRISTANSVRLHIISLKQDIRNRHICGVRCVGQRRNGAVAQWSTNSTRTRMHFYEFAKPSDGRTFFLSHTEFPSIFSEKLLEAYFSCVMPICSFIP